MEGPAVIGGVCGASNTFGTCAMALLVRIRLHLRRDNDNQTNSHTPGSWRLFAMSIFPPVSLFTFQSFFMHRLNECTQFSSRYLPIACVCFVHRE